MDLQPLGTSLRLLSYNHLVRLSIRVWCQSSRSLASFSFVILDEDNISNRYIHWVIYFGIVSRYSVFDGRQRRNWQKLREVIVSISYAKGVIACQQYEYQLFCWTNILKICLEWPRKEEVRYGSKRATQLFKTVHL